ncbi:MAG: hypothetical protein K2P94_10690 [Rhodospirillaceae bacterium]|nr:hypothetical protein [Rhodospirillaceae bacterium]
MDRKKAIAEVKRVFSAYRKIRPSDQKLLKALTDGKLYELFVLAYVVRDLTARGFSLTFVGKSLKFKAGPGYIKLSDPHFEVIPPRASSSSLRLFVNIEFETLGAAVAAVPDLSCHHEIDIVVVADVTTGRPTYDQIMLGVECKSEASLKKETLKEVLGIRRELSYLDKPSPSYLTMLGGSSVDVPARPPSEYWLAFIDPTATQYSASPARFGIQFTHIPI